MGNKYWRPGEPIVIEALGQSWTFTSDVIRLLPFNGLSPHDTLKKIILWNGSMKGYDDGVFQVDISGITLRFTVNGDQILVDDPYS